MTYRSLQACVLALSFMLTSLAYAQPLDGDGRFVFRYNAGLVTEKPGGEEDDSLGNFDVTARFFGVVNEPFESVVPTKPGAAVTEWEIESGILPKGLSFDSSTAMISGTPEEETSSRMLKVRGFAPDGSMGTYASVRIDIAAPKDSVVRHDFYGHTDRQLFEPIPSGAATVHRWIPETGMPSWSDISAGHLAGRPTQPGTWGYAMSGLDYSGHEVAYAYGSIVIEDGPLVSFIKDQSRHVTEQFSVGASVERSIGEVVWDVESGRLPEKLTLDRETGRISGRIPDFSTSATMVLRATDLADGTTGLSNPFTLSTFDPEVNLANLASLAYTVNEEHHYALTGKELVGEATWTVAEGDLPPGIALDESTGVIGGTATEVGDWPGVVIHVSTATSSDSSGPVTVRVHPDSLEGSLAPVHARVGASFSSGPAEISGGTAPYTFALAAGSAVPSGTGFDGGSGGISGSMQAPGDHSASVIPVDSTGREGASFKAPLYAYGPLQADVGQDLFTFTRLRAAQPIRTEIPEWSAIPEPTFALLPGEEILPEGLRFEPASGMISGTPGAGTVGSYGPFVIEVTDGSGSRVQTRQFRIEVVDMPGLTVHVRDVSVQRFIYPDVTAATATNAVGEVSFALASTSAPLPAGLSILPNGMIGGRTGAAEVHEGIVVVATDSEGRSDVSVPFSITPVQTGPMEASNVGLTWAQGVPFRTGAPKVSNAVGTVTWGLMSSSSGLPAGFEMDYDTGQIYGTSSEPGEYGPYVVLATDSMGRRASSEVWIRILPPLEVSVPLEHEGNRLSPLEPFRPFVRNGISPVRWSSASPLPREVGFEQSSGYVSGTPQETGTWQVEFTVEDAAGQTATVTTDLVVGERLPLSVQYRDLTLTKGGTLRGAILPASPLNAAPPVEFRIVQGELPPGLRFLPGSGGITGTPRQEGWWDGIVIHGVDAEGVEAHSDPFTMKVTLSGEVGVARPTVRRTRVDAAASTPPIGVSNVMKPLSFEPVPGPALVDPDGLTLIEGSGAIVGTPAYAGNRSWNLRVTDNLERSASFPFRLEVVNDFSFERGDIAVPLYSSATARPTVTNAVGAVMWTLDPAGGLPEGLEFDPGSGTVHGIPEAQGTFGPFTMRGEDMFDLTDHDETFMVTVGPRIPLEVSFEMPALALYQEASASPSYSGSVGAVAWSLSPAASSLPDGLHFDPARGAIHGTPLEMGDFGSFTLAAVDSRGGTDSVTFPLVVGERVSFEISYGTLTGQKGKSFKRGPHITGAFGETTFSADLTSLPPGLRFMESSGTFEGAPTQVGRFEVPVTAEDAVSSVPATATFEIAYPGEMEADPGEPYRVRTATQFTSPVPSVINGVRPLAFSASGSLHGLSLDAATGSLSGILSADGDSEATYEFGFGATDLFGKQAEFTSGIVAVPELDVSFDGNALVALANRPVSIPPAVIGALGTLEWRLVSGSFPDGVRMDEASGAMTGTPRELGTWNGIVIEALDVDGSISRTGAVSLTVQMNSDPILLATEAVTTKAGFPFSASLPFVDNTIGSYSFRSPQAEALGLKIDPVSGIVSGVLASHGNHYIDVDVTDSTDRVTSEPQIVEVLPAMRVSVHPHSTGRVNTEFEGLAPVAEYAIGSVTYELEGTLPEGLKFSKSTGEITGTAVEIGVSEPLRIVAEDSIGDRQPSNVFRIEFLDDGSTPTVSVPQFPVLKVGIPMADVVPSHGNRKTGDVFTTDRPLPGGLTLDRNTGMISGTPLPGAHGIHEDYYLRVTDVNGRWSETEPFRIPVRHQDAPVVAAADGSFRLRVGIPLTFMPDIQGLENLLGDYRISLSNNENEYTYSDSRVSFSFSVDDKTGEITAVLNRYTSGSAGVSIALRIWDEFGVVLSQGPGFTFHQGNLTVSLPELVAEEGSAVSLAPVVSGLYMQDTSYALSGISEVLPQGVSIDPGSGDISGTMPFGDYRVRVSVTDAGQTVSSGWATFRGTRQAPSEPSFTDLEGQEPGEWAMSDVIPLSGPFDTLIARHGSTSGGIVESRYCGDPDCGYVTNDWAEISARSVPNGRFVQLRAMVPMRSLSTNSVSFSIDNIGSWEWNVSSKELVNMTDASSVLPVSASYEGSPIEFQGLYGEYQSHWMNGNTSVEYDFGQPVRFNGFYVEITDGIPYYLDVEAADGGWQNVYGTSTGPGQKSLPQEYVVQRVRLRIASSSGRLSAFRIGNGGIHARPALPSGTGILNAAVSEQDIQLEGTASTSSYASSNSLTFSVRSGTLPEGVYFSGPDEIHVPALSPGSWVFTVRATDEYGFWNDRKYYLFSEGMDAAAVIPSSFDGGTSALFRLYDGNAGVNAFSLSRNAYNTFTFDEYVTFDSIFMAQIPQQNGNVYIDVDIGGEWLRLYGGNASQPQVSSEHAVTTKTVRIWYANSYSSVAGRLSEFRIGGGPVHVAPAFDAEFHDAPIYLGATGQSIQIPVSAQSGYTDEPLRFSVLSGSLPGALSESGLLELPAASDAGPGGWSAQIRVLDGFNQGQTMRLRVFSEGLDASSVMPSSHSGGASGTLFNLYDGNVSTTALSFARGEEQTIAFDEYVTFDSIVMAQSVQQHGNFYVEAQVGDEWLRLYAGNDGQPNAMEDYPHAVTAKNVKVRWQPNSNITGRLTEFRIGGGSAHISPRIDPEFYDAPIHLGAGSQSIQIPVTAQSEYTEEPLRFSVVSGNLPGTLSISGLLELQSASAAGPGGWSAQIRVVDGLNQGQTIALRVFSEGDDASDVLPSGFSGGEGALFNLYDGNVSTTALSFARGEEHVFTFDEYVTFDSIVMAQSVQQYGNFYVEAQVGDEWLRLYAGNDGQSNAMEDYPHAVTAKSIRVRWQPNSNITGRLTEFRIGGGGVYIDPHISQRGYLAYLGASGQSVQLEVPSTVNYSSGGLEFEELTGDLPSGSTFGSDGLLTLPSAAQAGYGNWSPVFRVSNALGHSHQIQLRIGSAGETAAEAYPVTAMRSSSYIDASAIYRWNTASAWSLPSNEYMTFEFEHPVLVDTLEILGGSDNSTRTVTVEYDLGQGGWTSLASRSWSARTSEFSGTFQYVGNPVVAKSIRFKINASKTIWAVKFGLDGNVPPDAP